MQIRPRPDSAATQPTRCRVTTVGATLYAFIEAVDDEPDLIRDVVSRRDDVREADWVSLSLDARHDRRSAYSFAVTAAGVQRDARVSDDVVVDDAWDAVWQSAVARTPTGWTAEIAIPLATLRATPNADGAWGIQVERWIERRQERSALAPYRIAEGRFVSRFATLEGTDVLPKPRQVEITAYVRADVRRASAGARPQHARPEAMAGLDVKLGASPSFTLDLTFNPDFGQVEADPSVVNLTAYETFLTERRPFFLEGAEMFRRKLSEVNDGSYLVYSRRIGRAPSLVDDSVTDAPAATTILGAAKLTGRNAAGWSVGLLEAVTAPEHARVRDGPEAERSRVVEPLTSYTAARVEHSADGGRTRTGAVVTAVRRHLDDDVRTLRATALTGGADVARRFADESLQLDFAAFVSHVDGFPEAMLATQLSPVHYFQRPGAPHLRVDASATSLDGWAAKSSLARITGRWRGMLLGEAISPGFEVNDLGYLPAADRLLAAAVVSYTRGEPQGPFNDWSSTLTAWDAWSFGGERTLVGGSAQGRVELRDASVFTAGSTLQGRALGTTELRGGPGLLTPVTATSNVGYASSPTRAVAADVRFDGAVSEDGLGKTLQLETGVRVRGGGRLRLSLRPRFASVTRGAQYVGAYDDTAGTRYVVGRLAQRTVSATAQIDFAVTPALTLQAYVQPFASVARFSDWKQVGDPQAATAAERFRPILDFATHPLSDPSFSTANLNTTIVLRWQPRTELTLFFVWSHRGNAAGAAAAGLGSAAGRLWRPDASLNDDVVLVKASWWTPGTTAVPR